MKKALFFAMLSVILWLQGHLARAADWPAGTPVTVVMTFPAGSGVDIVGRMLQDSLQKSLGVGLIFEYRPGAAGNVASEYVARARPDGHTILFGTAATHGVNAALYKKDRKSVV